MKVEMYLNPKAPNYLEFLADFKTELDDLKGLDYKQVEVPAPPKTLNVEHDILKFMFEHGAETLKLVTVLVQLARAVVERRNKPEVDPKTKEGGEPVAILKVDDRSIAFPASDNAERAFLKAVRKGKTKKVKKKASAKKPGGMRKHR